MSKTNRKRQGIIFVIGIIIGIVAVYFYQENQSELDKAERKVKREMKSVEKSAKKGIDEATQKTKGLFKKEE